MSLGALEQDWEALWGTGLCLGGGGGSAGDWKRPGWGLSCKTGGSVGHWDTTGWHWDTTERYWDATVKH